MTDPREEREEIARLGDAIYDRDVAPCLTAEDHWKIVAIDVDSGAFEVDADMLTAVQRVRAREPAARVWMRRVGSRYVRRFLTPIPVERWNLMQADRGGR